MCKFSLLNLDIYAGDFEEIDKAILRTARVLLTQR